MTFEDFWLGNGGVSGDFSFGAVHIVSICVIVLATAAICFVGLKYKASQRKLILSLAWFFLGFELFWRIFWLCLGRTFVNIYPFYPCNVNGILIPIAAILKNTRMKKLCYFFGFIGAVLTFSMPFEIFINKMLTFDVLKSVLQHTSILMIPAVEFVFGTFRQKFKDIGWFFLGIILFLINAEVMPLLFGMENYDFMFFRSGLPFVIEGVPQWITLSVFALLVLPVLCILLDLKGFMEFVKSGRKKAKAKV